MPIKRRKRMSVGDRAYKPKRIVAKRRKIKAKVVKRSKVDDNSPINWSDYLHQKKAKIIKRPKVDDDSDDWSVFVKR